MTTTRRKARKARKPQTGTLYVNGSCLGPAERDPATGTIESGPHVTARAAVSGIAVVRVYRSLMDPQRWSLTLACGHEVWITSAQRPKRKTSPCTTCPTSYPAINAEVPTDSAADPDVSTTTSASLGASAVLRSCPVCRTAMLDAPGHCPACGTIRLFEVKQPRVIRATYERQVWARDAEQAIAFAEQGTAWPQSYDESRKSVECGEWTADDVTATGRDRSAGGYTDDD